MTSSVRALAGARSALAAAAAVLCLAALPARAALQTWYVSGQFDNANCGATLYPPLAKAFPSGSSFSGSFTFDTAAQALFIYDGRFDFVTAGSSGGATQLVTRKYTLSTGSSRMITVYGINGAGQDTQQLDLNGNGPAQGAHHPYYGDPGLDLLNIARTSASYDWFTPGQEPASPPDLASANVGSPCVDIFYIDPRTGASFHRMGVVTRFADTPAAAAPR